MIQITSQYKKSTVVREFCQDSITIGRHDLTDAPDLDLHPDLTVSRRHARLDVDADGVWLEDTGSKYGVRVNGLKVHQKTSLSDGARIRIGATTLTLSLLEAAPEVGTTATLAKEELEPNVSIEHELDMLASTAVVANNSTNEHLRHLEILFNLPLVLAAQTSLDGLLDMIVQQLLEIIPGVSHSSLLLMDPLSKQLVLRAYAPVNYHSVSTTLARRAMKDGCGFIWRRSEGSLSETMRQMEAQTGMYAPLMSNGVAIGVIAVDSPTVAAAFSEASLRLIMAVGNYASLAVTNYRLKQDLQDNTRLLETLLSSFSPKIRNILLARAKRGHLVPGGEKSEVTVLFGDMRGFTRMCAGMDAAEVCEMLNDYFADLVEVIFQFDGTIDKFIGDAVLAVFGSPEADPQQHSNAVRAALAMQEVMKRVSERRSARRKQICEIGIGIHCGVVLHGFIGAADRLEFTVIGDTVNHASRLSSGAKGGEILISQDLFRHVFSTAKTERISITTKHQETLEAHRVKTLFETH